MMKSSSGWSLLGGLILGVALVAVAAGVLYFQGYRLKYHPPALAPAAGQKILCYVSPTDPGYLRQEPGKDPQGQDLVPVYAPAGAVPAVPASPKGDRQVKYWVSPMDPGYVRDKPGKAPCGMDLVPVYEDAEDEPAAGVIAVSPQTLQTMGVRTATVPVAPLSRTIRAVSRVTFNERALAQVSTKINGWVEKLAVRATGDPIRKGQLLLEIYSPELVSTQREYLLARQHGRSLAHSSIPEVREGARRLLEASRQRLLLWDIAAAQIEALEQAGAISRTLALTSPVAGIVTKRQVTAGQYVTAGQTLLEVADLSTVWVEADVYEYELPWIKVGQPATLTLTYLPGEAFAGRVEYIYPYLQGATRTARVRLTFPNPRLRLKPEMYGQVEIRVTAGQATPLLPSEAVLDTGARQHVFLALGGGRFAPREIKLGLQGDDGRVQVLAGLHGGEEVVTSAQFLLDSESRFREAVAQMLGSGDQGGASKETAPPMPPGHHHHYHH
ncbi:MAG: efflux RND transporter periplasmic adaptor subunit [Desulfobacca sp.]|uniref:efflux RND transporter periplasmic adaptor subunit n=1 Tax=Desulfobacca sp. TaxID=2067990 RepID=UPI00404981E9